jgi:pimeloyl-ACP methyl ester carboxylesterase
MCTSFSNRYLTLVVLVVMAGLPRFGWAAESDAPAYGPELQGFDYPHPVQHYDFGSQDAALQMAFMDVAPDHPNGRTVVLLHGKNFCGATWDQTITALVGKGYRVIAPDQIGFCKSSKPAHYHSASSSSRRIPMRCCVLSACNTRLSSDTRLAACSRSAMP